MILFAPIFIAARYYSHKKRRDALAASTVKVYGNDVVATWKILIAAGLAPTLYTCYAVLLALWAWYNSINGSIPKGTPSWKVAGLAYLVFPTITYAALRFGEIGMDIFKSLWPLLLCLSSKSNTLETLRLRRIDLARQVADVIDRLGPDMFPDCDAEKLPFPRRVYGNISPFATLDDLDAEGFFV